VQYYYDKFGNKYKCLFREEGIWDNIIKNFFYMFGNGLFYKTQGKIIAKRLNIS